MLRRVAVRQHGAATVGALEAVFVEVVFEIASEVFLVRVDQIESVVNEVVELALRFRLDNL